MISNIGIQTYTVRKAQAKSIEGAYMPLIKLGIKKYEIARMDFNEKNANDVKRLKDEYGIEVCSVQVKPKYVFGDIDKVARFCEISGCKNVVISMLPFECILGGEDRFYRFISTLDGTYEKYEARGLTLAYHHHNWEYVRLSNGRTRMQELLALTKDIKIVHDTYWAAKSGVSPALQIRELGDRLLGVHLRDITCRARGLDVVSSDTAIGDGSIDFSEVLRAAEEVGCSYYVIEEKTKDPYAEIEKSYKRLEEIRSGLSYKERE